MVFLRHLMLVALLMVVWTSVFAQGNKLSAGIQAGPGLNNLRGNRILKEYHRSSLGYTAGLAVNYQLNNRVSLVSGLSYTESGSGMGPYDVYDNSGAVMGEMKSKNLYRYVMMPVTIDHASGKKLRFVVGGGGFAAYLLDARNKGVIKTGSRDIEVNESFTGLKKLNAGVIAKAGLEMPLRKNVNFYFVLADHLGLINISETPVVDNGSIKTNSLNLIAGLKWKL